MQLPELFRINKTRWIDSDGKRVKSTTPGAIKSTEQSKDWYADIPVVESPTERIARKKSGKRQPRRRRVRLCQNKRASQKMVREMVEAAEKKAAGLVDYIALTQRPTGELVDGFRDHLLAKGNTEQYVELTIKRIETVFAGCLFLRVADLNADKAAVWLYKQRQETLNESLDVKGIASSYKQIAEAFDVAERTVTYWRKQGAPIIPRGKTNMAEVSAWLNIRNTESMGASTSNHYVTALRSFGKWLVKSAQAIDANPFESLEKIDARTDVRKSRRVLNHEDFVRLIEAATTNPWMFRGLAGEDRSMIYVVAAYTGLRSGEIASLTRSSFELESNPPVVVVEAAYTKNKELARIPLRADLVAQLRDYLHGMEDDDKAWPGTWSEDGAKMIRGDLKAAGIEYSDARGNDYDFHALRHQFITELSRAGVSLRVAQELARHSKPELTANIYTHLSTSDTLAEVEKLAAVPQKPKSGSVGSDGDIFGPADGQAGNEKRGTLSNIAADEPIDPENEKSPAFVEKTGLFWSDADGTRTRNLRIDSPGL